MAKVNGNYTICSNLDFSNNGTPTPAYQFAGNNRNASFTGHVPDKIMETVCTSTDLGGGYAAFNANAEIRIKRARLNADGACGLQCAPGKLAGRFYLGVRQGATGYKPDGATPSAELAAVCRHFLGQTAGLVGKTVYGNISGPCAAAEFI